MTAVDLNAFISRRTARFRFLEQVELDELDAWGGFAIRRERARNFCHHVRALR